MINTPHFFKEVIIYKSHEQNPLLEPYLAKILKRIS